MIMSDNVNEFIYKMKLKKKLLGGIKEESVYANMRKLSELYEEQIAGLKEQITGMQEQIETLQKQADTLEQNLIEAEENQKVELYRMKNNYTELLQAQQDKINRFREVCEGMSEQIGEALEQYRPR